MQLATIRSLLALGVALLSVGLAAPRVRADPTYNAITLMPSGVSGLNDSGQLVVAWNNSIIVYNGYGSWANETQPPVPTPPGFYYQSNGNAVINNSGQVAADAVTYVFNPPNYSYYWHATETVGQTAIDLGTLGGPNTGVPTSNGTLGHPNSGVAGINDSGQVIGNSDTAAGTSHAFLATNGKMVDLGTLPGGSYSTALGINNAGQVVGYAQVGSANPGVWGRQFLDPTTPLLGGGYHAVLYQQGKVIDLGTLGGAGSVAAAINQSGQIVGTAETAAGAQHAFLYQNGKMQDLGTLASNVWAPTGTPGTPYSQATAINNSGQIVGQSNGLAFLDTNGKMYNLNDLVKIPNVTLVSALAINNVGQILATGYAYSSLYTGPYPEMEYLLNPSGLPTPEYGLPEPNNLYFLGVVAIGLAARELRRRSRQSG